MPLEEESLTTAAHTDLTITVRVTVNNNQVDASVEWNSLLDWETVRQIDDDQSEKLYEQEHLLVKNEVCPITEIEADIVRKVSSFFDH